MARKVLLADDSVTAQNMGRRILIDAGYEVITVNNGSAALKKIAEHKPDLIIVDVYMPGYGGLEVCSRVKEMKETSRIPVLLTVGKLEPFKPDEARKVRADAFIVKPFEASELLTALTKLEDKIVPGPEPYKPGRFASALASVEGSGDKAESFGDTESGWKNRLTIPAPHMKPSPHADPVEVPKPAAEIAHDLGRDEDFKPVEPSRGFERPLPAGLPQDIRPEEIAAIAAAAAALRGDSRPEEAEAVSQLTPVEETPVEETKPVEDTKPVEVVAETQPVFEEQVTQEPVASQVPVEEKHEAKEEAPAPVEAVAEAKTPEPAAEPEKVHAHDAELLAALATLTPANDENHSEKRDEEPVTVAVGTPEAELAAVGASFTGPRWISEAISVPIEEATRPLEQEMHKAFAAFAAADGFRLLMAAPVREEAPRSESAAVAEGPVSEAVAVDESMPAAASALAAAAGIGEVSSPAISQQVSAPEVAVCDSTAADSSDAEPRRESELAAAWENWRHIRETIIGPETAPAAPEAAAEASSQEVAAPEAKEEVAAAESIIEAKPEETKVEEVKIQEAKTEEAKVEPEKSEPVPEVAAKAESDGDSADSANDPEALASIVDDMLADLKPKLMEELSKKLSKGKKKKKS